MIIDKKMRISRKDTIEKKPLPDVKKSENRLLRVFLFKTQVFLGNAVYIKANKLNSIFCLDNGEEKIYKKNIGVIEKILSKSEEWIRIHPSYIVKVNFIKGIDFEAEILRLDNGTVLPVSNKYIEALKVQIKF